MSKFTAGPWFVESDDKTPIYVSPVDRYEQIAICSVFTIDEDDSESGDWINGEETKANARLIAAAPDLLEAAERYLNFRHAGDIGQGYQFSGVHPQTQLKTAIAKARGQA